MVLAPNNPGKRAFSPSMGGIKLKAAKFSEEQGAERQRAGKVHPEIDIHYKSKDKGRDNAKAYQPFST